MNINAQNMNAFKLMLDLDGEDLVRVNSFGLILIKSNSPKISYYSHGDI